MNLSRLLVKIKKCEQFSLFETERLLDIFCFLQLLIKKLNWTYEKEYFFTFLMLAAKEVKYFKEYHERLN